MLCNDFPISLDKIYEYRPEFNLRYIPTDFPKEKRSILKEFGYVLKSQEQCLVRGARNFLDYTDASSYYDMPKRYKPIPNELDTSDDINTFHLTPFGFTISSQEESNKFLSSVMGRNYEPLFKSIGPQNSQYLGQEPFHPMMPWSTLDVPGNRPSRFMNIFQGAYDQPIKKYMVAPLREKTLVTYFQGNKNIPVAKATFVFCSIAPFEESTSGSEPKFEWLRTSWLKPQTWKTSAQESNERIREAFQTVLSRYKK